MYNREGPKEKERDTAQERMERERSKRASKRPIGNPEETFSEEPKEKKSRKNSSVEDNIRQDEKRGIMRKKKYQIVPSA